MPSSVGGFAAPPGPLLAPAAFGPPASFAPPAEPARPRLDPLDTIARLAQLRDAGAITEAEFEREKAKLLDQI